MTRVAPVLVVGAVVAALWASRSGEDSQPSSRARPSKKEAPDGRDAATRNRKQAVRHATSAALAAVLKPDENERARAVAKLRELGPEAMDIIRDCFGKGVEDPMGLAAAYALACLGDETDHAHVAQEFVARHSEPPPLLALAAAELRDPDLVTTFAALRTSQDTDVRLAVTRGLRAGNQAPIGDLLPLLADPEPRVRASAERTLVEIMPRAHAETVRREAENAMASSDTSMRVAALRLVVAADAPWADQLAIQATRDGHPSVRREATEVLGQIGRPSGAAALVGLVEKGADRDERVRAATALGTVAAPPEALDALAKVASRGDPVVALAAARTLAAQRDERAIPSLVRLQSVKESAALRVDEEDADLLRDMSGAILGAASRHEPRRRGETWAAWWKRVGPGFRIPADTTVPDFPWNH